MIIINMTHQNNAEEMAPFVEGHKAFVGKHLANGNIILAGPKNTIRGGILLTHLDAAHADKMMREDPYIQNKLSEYSLISFAAKAARSDASNLKEA